MLTITRMCFLLFLWILLSCSPQSARQPDIEGTLSSLIKKYPQLPKDKANQLNFYRLVRSVSFGAQDVELQLRASPDTIKNSQSIILFINGNKNVYGIPMLTNDNRKYWNFLFDSITNSEEPTNTTFQQELQNCIDTLGLNDTLWSGSKVIHEMLVSLLHCRLVYDSDSADIRQVSLDSNYDLPEENQDSCQLRFNKNWNTIFKDMHPYEHLTLRNAYWDKKNGRIYQFDFYPRRKEKLKVGLKAYRQQCISQPTIL